MPKARINVKVDQRGPIFDAARTKAAALRAIVEVNEVIAKEGVNRVLVRLAQVLRNPSGYYESNIMIERREIYRGITDNNVIYGPWLEGTGSRNRTTRFKGYRTFRTVKQELDNDSRSIAQPVIDRLVQELRG